MRHAKLSRISEFPLSCTQVRDVLHARECVAVVFNMRSGCRLLNAHCHQFAQNVTVYPHEAWLETYNSQVLKQGVGTIRELRLRSSRECNALHG